MDVINLKDIPSFVFSGGEVHVDFIPSSPEFTLRVREYDPVNQIKLFLVLDSVVRQFGGEASVTIDLAYLPYARQDKVHAKGQALSLSWLAYNLNRYQTIIKSVIVFEPHSETASELLKLYVPVEIIKLGDVLDYEGISKFKKLAIVAPDEGAMERASYVYSKLPLMYDVVMVQAIKKRDPSTGRIISYELQEGVKGRDCVVIDDICDGGATFELLGECLKKEGSLSNNLIVAHGIFSKGKERLNELYDTIFAFYDWTT